MDSVFKRPCFQSHDETTVIVWFNESEFVKVGRQKLIYSSLYFKCILTSNFRDRNSEFVEVKYPTSFETFKIAIDFANCYHIGQNDENSFEVFQLADYLQFDLLKKSCVNHFTTGLNRKNIQAKYHLLKTLNFPTEEFKVATLNKFCGLYVTQIDLRFRDRTYLEFYNEESNCFETVHCHHHDPNVVWINLYCVRNTLVTCPSVIVDRRTEASMISYDLSTGKNTNTTLSCGGRFISSSDGDKIFVINEVKND